MKTTALIVEILVVGILGALVLLPVAAEFADVEVDTVLRSVGQLALVVQLALAYALGVMWNRLCNGLFSAPERVVQSTLRITKSQNQRSRIRLSSEASPLNDYLVATRGLIRVARASCVLLVAYTGFGLLKVPAISYAGGLKGHPPPLLTLVLLVLSVYSWWRLYRGYLLTISDADTAG